ncbi:MAG: TIGR04219 family outer membrane beta-barrel protein [Cellvibrionaceae bacterium]
MKKTLSTALFSLITVSASLFSTGSYSVPLIDVYVTVGEWQPDYSGDIGINDNTATLEELGFDDDSHNTFSLVFKHPIPGIPNAKIRHSDISTSASGTLERSLEFNDITFSASEDVETDLDLTHTDFTLFYSPLNNWIQIDLGLTGRRFDAEGTITGSVNGTESETFDEWVPMLYLGARFELPLSGLYADATLNTVNYDGNEVSDLTAAVGYAFDLTAVDIVAEVGYRTFTFKLDEDDNDIGADLELDGLYFNLGFQF